MATEYDAALRSDVSDDPRQPGEVDTFWRRCLYCEGHGCEECDETGYKYRSVWTTHDGYTLSLAGSGRKPTRETIAVVEAVARKAAPA